MLQPKLTGCKIPPAIHTSRGLQVTCLQLQASIEVSISSQGEQELIGVSQALHSENFSNAKLENQISIHLVLMKVEKLICAEMSFYRYKFENYVKYSNIYETYFYFFSALDCTQQTYQSQGESDDQTYGFLIIFIYFQKRKIF